MKDGNLLSQQAGDHVRAIGKFKVWIEDQGRRALEMGVSIERSHDHSEVGKTVTPEFDIADCPSGTV